MEEIPITKFRTSCHAALERVRRTKRPVLVTRLGEPVAEIIPIAPVARPKKDWLGSLAGTGRIVGDIVSPAGEESDWEALRQ
jgi:prevent-host-death family protein